MTAGIAAKRPIAVAISASAMPGATLASVAWLTLASPRNAFMMPHTVPKRPMYGDTEPTVARPDRFASSASISRWYAARIARRARSSVTTEALPCLRCFAYSRKPAVKMCSMPPPVRACCVRW